ncbi:dihydrofolate reductase family protein [Sinomonas susongensis]|uniref:dihydrofolate reductase family protein n=1 Tax=Sinomonas susongensis TaxID=1324851 RepID=UPI001107F3CC|nr:dihydrofolate reductase family protein [Sinomonas susongensis]
MTDVIYRTATSFNGFIADESNSLDWLFAVDDADTPDQPSFLEHIGVIVEGSTTYEWLLEHTEVLRRPEQWREFYGDRPTYVFTSRRLTVPDGADVRFVNGPVLGVLPEILAAADGKDVWVAGGGELAGQFADVDALDRIELTLAPVSLAAGARLFPRRLESDRLHLTSAERHGEFLDVTYTVSSEAGGDRHKSLPGP